MLGKSGEQSVMRNRERVELRCYKEDRNNKAFTGFKSRKVIFVTLV